MTTVYLIRHLETQANIARTLQGQHDTAPTEFGLRQLEWLRERFANVDLDVIYTSPLGRAKMTAEAVKGKHDIPLIEDKRIMEINLGDMENTSVADMEFLYPDQYISFSTNLHTLSAPNGENVEQVYNRMSGAISDIVNSNPGKTVAVVSHGLALQSLVSKLHGKDYTYVNEVELGQNTSVSKVTFDEDDSPTICYLGDISHMPKEHRKSRYSYIEKKEEETK